LGWGWPPASGGCRHCVCSAPGPACALVHRRPTAAVHSRPAVRDLLRLHRKRRRVNARRSSLDGQPGTDRSFPIRLLPLKNGARYRGSRPQPRAAKCGGEDGTRPCTGREAACAALKEQPCGYQGRDDALEGGERLQIGLHATALLIKALIAAVEVSTFERIVRGGHGGARRSCARRSSARRGAAVGGASPAAPRTRRATAAPARRRRSRSTRSTCTRRSTRTPRRWRGRASSSLARDGRPRRSSKPCRRRSSGRPPAPREAGATGGVAAQCRGARPAVAGGRARVAPPRRRGRPRSPHPSPRAPGATGTSAR
jgi:hypothetical protein